jgi:hypothetical protein
MHELIRTWRQFDTRHRPYVLPGDDRVLRDTDCFRCASWAAYCANPNFGAVESGHFHVDLLPVPFAGRLDRASVFVLLLNPGFGPHDYFAESKVRAFREMRIANLRQSAAARFDYLSPDFSWHGGFRYWHGRLSPLISKLAEANRISYGAARQFVQSRFASIELVPYHSKHFSFPTRLVPHLKSVQLVKAYVHDVVVPRARGRDALVVATRSASLWQLPKLPNIVSYVGAETRSAHLSLKSRGGQAIVRFLQKQYEHSAA